jgi:multidrug resistance protein
MTFNVEQGAPAQASSKDKRALSMIFFVLLMDVVGLSILYPIAALIVQRYNSDAFTVTLLTGIYAAAQFFAAPLLGNISDRVGRRPVLLVSVFGSAIGYFIFGIGGALWILFLARLIDGITAGNLSTASAYIADVSLPHERAKNFALIGVAFGLGFIIGPALGGLVGQISLEAPAFLAGILSLVSVAGIYFFLPESHPIERREKSPFQLKNLNPLLSIGEIVNRPGMPLLMFIQCIFALTFNGVISTLPVYLRDVFSARQGEIAGLFVVGGIITMIMQAKFVQPLIQRFGEKTMTIVSLVSLSIGTLLIGLVPSYAWLYPTLLLRNGLGGIFWGTIAAMTASKVQPREQGKLAGVNTGLQSSMAIFGPIGAGLAYDNIMPGAPFWIGAILFSSAALISFAIQHNKLANTQASWEAH